MKRRPIILLLILSIALSAVACVKERENGRGRSVVDHLGRTVALEKDPERIVSGYYIATSALIALGLEDKLVGIEAKADTRPIYALAAPELLKLPNVGTAKDFDLEGCIALKPDLVILPIRLEDQVKALEDMGIPVLGVNPENQELLEEMIAAIAELTGAKNHKELLSYYEEKEKELREYQKGRDKPRVYLAGNSSFLRTAAKNMYQNDLIEAAGGVNVAGDIEGSYWVDVSYEQLIKYNPEVIIIVPEADYTARDLLGDENLSGISAIEKGQVYQMPREFEAWDSPVPSGILGKMWLTSILYEEHYPMEKFAREAAEFYKRFYDFEADIGALMAHGR